MSTKLTYTGAEVQELLDKIGKGDFDNAKTLEGHPASYFAVASELTSLAESFATEQGRINTLYSYFNNGSANDALSLGGQLPSYYATATQYEILQQALSDFKSLFDSMFEKDSEGNIHAKLSLWSSGGITAGGAGSGGSGGGGISYSRLDSWTDYSADKSGWVLSALLGKDLDSRVSALANAGYVTASTLAPYALRSELPIITKDGLKSTLGISDWALAATKPTYTASEVGALSVNGGHIYGSLYITKSSKQVYIAYEGASESLGYIGFNGKNSPIYIPSEANVIYSLIHSGNYSDYALPKTGGTLTGTTSIPLYIKSSHATEAAVGFGANNAKGYGYIVYKGGDSWAVTKEQWGAEYSILHTGNYSNLLAGGTINGGMTFASGNLIVSNGHTVVGELYPKNDGSIDLGQGSRKWKDVYLGGYLTWGNSVDSTDLGDWEALKDNIGLRIISSKTSDSGAPYQYATALHIRGRYGFELAVQGGDIDSFAIRSVTNNRGWNRLLHSGNYSNLLANGTINGSITASSFIGNLTGNADSANYILTKLKSGDAFYPDKYKAYIQWVSEDTAVMKFTDGDYQFRANSATKLATPRTIWGQSFDGTGNISGNLIGDIWRILKDPTFDGVFIQSKNYAGTSDLGNIFITAWNGNELYSFNVWANKSIFMGNVAIGGKTADEKLHVHGNGKFTGALTANSLTIGGATITYDSVNEALCINGNMYALGGITSGGAGISAYSSLESRVARLEQQLNIS
jgi:hypothetical protein